MVRTDGKRELLFLAESPKRLSCPRLERLVALLQTWRYGSEVVGPRMDGKVRKGVEKGVNPSRCACGVILAAFASTQPDGHVTVDSLALTD